MSEGGLLGAWNGGGCIGMFGIPGVGGGLLGGG